MELNPGPTYKYPCGACSRPCKSNQQAILCDNCDCWFHKKCLSMNSAVYEALANSSCSWICCQCDLPNFSSSLFDSTPSFINSNSFAPLQNSTDHTPQIGNKSPPFRPGKASTPKKSSLSNKKKPQDENSHPPKPNIRRNSLTSLVINFRSLFLRKHLVSNLVSDLSNSVGCDLIFGTETWLREGILNSELNLNEFDIWRNDRALTKRGGGVFLCIKKVFNSIFICEGKKSETVFAKINIPGKAPIVLCCAYRAPDLSFDNCKILCDEIREVKNKFKNSIFILSGDFNLPDINWKTNTIVGSQYSLSKNQLFLDLTHDLGLTQTVQEPTRGNNILDLFFHQQHESY